MESVLSEDFIDNGGQMNFLIEGDNPASLKLLEKTYKGKIDLIYIDPPYNTGSPYFKYDDTIVAKGWISNTSGQQAFVIKF